MIAAADKDSEQQSENDTRKNRTLEKNEQSSAVPSHYLLIVFQKIRYHRFRRSRSKPGSKAKASAVFETVLWSGLFRRSCSGPHQLAQPESANPYNRYSAKDSGSSGFHLASEFKKETAH